MHILSIDGLYACSYSAQPLNALKQYWRTQKSFSCLGEPKKTDILLFLHGCRAEYTMPDGRKLYAQSGDIVYTPKGSQYTVAFLDFEDSESHTVGVNFSLTDEQGEPFRLAEEILVFSNPGCGALFAKLVMYGEAAVRCPARMKAALYDILSNLSEASRSSSLSREKFGLIAKGIACLEQETTQKRSIREIAQLCNVSEIYFRRLFKVYSGVTPSRYRIQSKLERAKGYLTYENLTVQEIADRLDFGSAAYFTSQFKAYTGMTPTAFKKSNGV